MLLSSASSKTAYGTAFQLAQRPGIEVVGLTSRGNVAFCESLGCYSRVVTYDQLDSIAAGTACVYVDFAGNAALRQHIHSRFGQLRHDCSIGGTHVDELAAKGSAREVPGPRPTLFFAPAQVKKRIADWGPPAFAQQWPRRGRTSRGKSPAPSRPGSLRSAIQGRRPCRPFTRMCCPARAIRAPAISCCPDTSWRRRINQQFAIFFIATTQCSY
jgi:hypothetical protein